MQSKRPRLSDPLRITNCLEKPPAEKWGGASSHRRVVKPKSEHGLVAIVGADGLFYANAVCGLGRLKLGPPRKRRPPAVDKVGRCEKSAIIIPRRRTFLAEDEIFGEVF